MKLAKDETIVTAWAERASGPGWANQPVYVLVRDSNGKLRTDAIHPDEHSAEVHVLYDVNEAAHIAMTNAVRKIAKRQS